MIIKLKHSIRQANSKDHKELANLIHFGTLIHRHLDWRPPIEWIGHYPFLVLEKDDQIVAALACPPDPPSVVWVRLFVTYDEENLIDTWSRLWSEAIEVISPDPNLQVAAIPLQKWFENLLQISQFQQTTDVVMLIWDNGKIPTELSSPEISIRPMNTDDLPQVEYLDKSSFGSLWHNSRTSLEHAFNTQDTSARASVMLFCEICCCSLNSGGPCESRLIPRKKIRPRSRFTKKLVSSVRGKHTRFTNTLPINFQ
jgi:hypothetical protein